MECNKEEAARAMQLAEKKFLENDIKGSQKFALKAQRLFPSLEGLVHLMAVLDIHLVAEGKKGVEIDWYGILQVDPKAEEGAIKKQYRKLALLLHPDKNKVAGAESAFKLLSEAWGILSDRQKKADYDMKRNSCSKQTLPTFWTICPACRLWQQYTRASLNHNLCCPGCWKSFIAHEILVPSSGKPPQYQAPQNAPHPETEVDQKVKSQRKTRKREQKQKQEQKPRNCNEKPSEYQAPCPESACNEKPPNYQAPCPESACNEKPPKYQTPQNAPHPEPVLDQKAESESEIRKQEQRQKKQEQKMKNCDEKPFDYQAPDPKPVAEQKVESQREIRKREQRQKQEQKMKEEAAKKARVAAKAKEAFDRLIARGKKASPMQTDYCLDSPLRDRSNLFTSPSKKQKAEA